MGWNEARLSCAPCARLDLGARCGDGRVGAAPELMTLEGPLRDSPRRVRAPSPQRWLEEGHVWSTEASWRVLPSSGQQMAMSPCQNRRDGGRCCADSLGTADKATSLVGPAPLSEAVGSPEALGVWWKCSLALG